MGRRLCCVLNCPSRRSNVKRSLFNPPLKNPRMLKMWEEALKDHVAPSSFPFNVRTFICELHFKPKHLDQLFTMKMPDGSTWTEKKERTRLFAGSVPSLFKKDELKTSVVEVKAPKCKQTYVFDFEESCDDSGSQATDDEEHGGEAEKDYKGRSEVEEEKATNQECCNTRLLQNNCFESENLIETVVTQETAAISKVDGGQIEIIFSEVVDDGSGHDSNRGDNTDDDDATKVSGCHPDPLEIKSKRGHDIASSSQIDVREILGPPETEKSVINDINEFSRLCRKYIATTLIKKGRPSLMDKYGLDPSSPKTSEKSVYIYPTAKMDTETLVSHIDHVKLPSENWFCTVKDGSPTFLCWKENFSIHKKVIFDMKNLQPSVQLGDDGVHFSEIAKPRSIVEVTNILKLVDSAQKCPEKDRSVCKGYFFPGTSKGVSMCHPCITVLNSKSLEVLPFSFQLVKDSAQDIIADLHNWSVTVLGTSLIFIGWKKPYIPEKLYILKSDLTAQITFGEESTSFDEICFPQSIDDVKFAIKFLEGCVKCIGVDESHRSERCRGFVYRKTQRTKNRTCTACGDLRKKLIRAVPGDCVVKHTMARHNLPKKLTTKSLAPNWVREEENSSDQTLEAEEEHILLPNALDAITLPSNRWTHAVVDNAVIFQYWKDNFTLLKKVLIDHDLSVQISVLDRCVELEEVDVVSSVDDVVRILNVVDCLRVCEGYDESYRKAKDCTGYIYDPDDMESKTQATPYMCPKCAALRKFQIGFGLRKSPTKSRIQILERMSDDAEPSSKKLALEVTMSPSLPSRPQCKGS